VPALEFPPYTKLATVSEELLGYVQEVDGGQFIIIIPRDCLPIAWIERIPECDELWITPADQLHETERPYLREGAYVRVGLGEDAAGNAAVEVVFNRACWTQEDLDRAHAHAERLSRAIRWE
jgi:hypothetical protein